MLLTSMKNSLIALLISFLSLSIWSESFKTFYENGNIKNEGITKEEPNSDGWYPGTMLSNSNNTISQEQYLYKNGWYKFYDYYGKELKREGRGIKGLSQGVWKFYKEGHLYSEVTYKDDVKNGLFKTYYENGKLRSKGINKEEKLDGLFEIYFETGNLAIQASFKDGAEEGIASSYYKNGNERSRINYRQGKKYGFSQEFYEDGLLQKEGNYVLNTKDGLWKRYNLEGEKSLETIYNMGEVKEYPCRPEFCPIVNLSFTSPTYPMRAVRDEGEGCVMVEFTLSEKGIPLDERVLWSKSNSKRTKYLPDDIFDKPALESVRTYRYRPQHIDGIPTAVENVKSIIVFRLEDIDSMPQECKS